MAMLDNSLTRRTNTGSGFDRARRESLDHSFEGRQRRITDFLRGQGDPFGAANALTDPFSMPDDAGARSGLFSLLAQGGMAEEGFRLRDVEDERFASSSARLTGATDRLVGTETFSDEEFEELRRQMFAMGADQAAQRLVGDLGTIRSALGAAGITGGGIAADLASKAELERFRATMETGRRSLVDLRQAKIQADASDQARNFQAELMLANFNNQSPSLLGLDTLTNLSELRLAEQGAERSAQAAERASDAQEDAGLMGLLGGVLEGAFGLF